MKEAVLKLPDIKAGLLKTLSQEGFIFPQDNDCHESPGKWLLRSEPLRNLGQDDYRLRPKSGEFSSFGVFLTDSPSVLPVDFDKAYYLFDRDKISPKWQIVGSHAWIEDVDQVCRLLNLDPSKTGNYYYAERSLYESRSTYNPIKKIFTVPQVLSPSDAVHIYVSQSDLNNCYSFLADRRVLRF